MLLTYIYIYIYENKGIVREGSMEIKYILNNKTHVLHKADGCSKSKSYLDDKLEFENPDTVIAYRVPGYVLCENCFSDAIAKAERMSKK